MDKPKQPTKDLIDLTKIGPIMAFTYDRDLSQNNKSEAECEAQGHYTYDCILRVRGYSKVDDLHVLDTFITETTFIKFVEIGTDINEYGFWRVTVEGHALVADWEKWLKKEDKDVREYKRLKKKFGGVLD